MDKEQLERVLHCVDSVLPSNSTTGSIQHQRTSLLWENITGVIMNGLVQAEVMGDDGLFCVDMSGVAQRSKLADARSSVCSHWSQVAVCCVCEQLFQFQCLPRTPYAIRAV